MAWGFIVFADNQHQRMRPPTHEDAPTRLDLAPTRTQGCTHRASHCTHPRLCIHRDHLWSSNGKAPGHSARGFPVTSARGFPVTPSHSHGLGEPGGVDDVAVARTLPHHADREFASIRTSYGISPHFFGVAIPYARSGFSCSKGSIRTPNQSSQIPAF